MRIHDSIMVNTQAVRHTVDEIEVAGDKACGADLCICPPVYTEDCHVGFGVSRRVHCERNTPIKERAELVAHWCGAVVSNYGLDEFLGGASRTESLPVRERSIETIVGATHQCGDQFPGFPRQRIVLRCGGREVEVHAGA